jgi:DNA polymerase phi
MKGSEERDLMFGKLFGYLSLIRSGKLENDEENVVLIVDKLLDLHNRKGWIREVVSESILTLLAVISGDMIKLVIPKLRTLLGNGDVPLCDMTAWQLMLCVGLQQLAATKGTGAESVKEELIELLPQIDIVTPGSLQEMIPTLMEATAGFPKVPGDDALLCIVTLPSL